MDVSSPVGESLPRLEDARFVRGQGQYVADIAPRDALELHLVRSPIAHARIQAIRVRGTLPSDVHGPFTAADLQREGLLAAAAEAALAVPLLAVDEVRYVGQPVAALVAPSRYQAEDAAEELDILWDPLPIVANWEQALAPNAPQVQPDIAGNVAVERTLAYGAVDQVWAEAPVHIEATLRVARASAHPLEPRGVVAVPDRSSGGVVVWANTQVPHGLQRTLSRALGLPISAVRVIAPDVGGAFGVKAHIYGEEILAAWLALRLGRPVRWLEDRGEHFVATLHEREQVHWVRMAADSEGHVLAVDDSFVMDLGAWPLWPHVMQNTALMLLGPYQIPHFRCHYRGVLTHKTPVGPYRGAGRPLGNFVIERMMDRLARTLGVDPAEIRRRNLIPGEAMPYTTPLGNTYDSGDYIAILDRALSRANYAGWRQRQQTTNPESSRLGIGVACYIEDTGGAGPYEGAALRLDADGTVRLWTGAPSSGQSHATTFAQVAASILKLPIDRIRVQPTDTRDPLLGIGTFGSRSAVVGASAVYEAAHRLAAKVRQLGAALLEAAPEDVELSAAGVQVQGVPSRQVSWAQLAEMGNFFSFGPLPPGVTPGLDATAYAKGGRPTYGCGAHVAVVSIDPVTFQVKVLAYTVVHDCGTLLNPLVVTGQVQGGVTHGLGTALWEELRYDATGQLQNQTYLDYVLPSAVEVPPIVVEHVEYPSPWTPTGAKGAGEGGTIPALAAIANAVEDALSPWGVVIEALPITPESLWRQIEARRQTGARETPASA